MAQNTWINITLDTGGADIFHKVHTVNGGAAAAGDVTLSYDSAKLLDLNTADSVLKAFRLRLVSSGFK